MVAFISMARPFLSVGVTQDVPDVCTVIALQVRGTLHAPFNKNLDDDGSNPFGSTLNFCAYDHTATIMGLEHFSSFVAIIRLADSRGRRGAHHKVIGDARMADVVSNGGNVQAKQIGGG
jgi:hypothetical protein